MSAQARSVASTGAGSECASCPTCGAPLTGTFCAGCGQRAPAADDFSVRRFFRAVTREVGDGDSRSWRTLRNVLNPGELTRAFLAREWRRYLPPLRLYLVLSGVFFLAAWDPYYAMQAEQLRALPAEQIPEDVRAVLTDPRLAGAASDWTALLRFLGVLLFALAVALLHVRRRLPLGAHLVFATHYYCADYLIFTLAAPLIVLLAHYGLGDYRMLVVGACMLALLAWMLLALQRVYRRGWISALLVGLALFAVDMLLSQLAGGFGSGIAAGIESARNSG